MKENYKILELAQSGSWGIISIALKEEKTLLNSYSPSRLYLDAITDLIKLGKKKEALDLIDLSLNVYPNSATLHNIKGLVYQLKESHGLAVKSYKQALKLLPEYSLAWNNLGTIYSGLNMLSDALTCYKHAVHHNPEYSDAIWNLANGQFCINEFDDCILNCKKLLTSDKKSNAYYLMGLICRKRESYDAAIKLFKKALKSSSIRFYDAEFELATCFANTNNFSAALSTYYSMVESPTLGSKAYASIGLVLSRLGRLKESLKNFAQAMSMGEESEDALNGYALVLNDFGDHDFADAIFTKALKIYHESFNTNFNYGVHLHNSKMYKQSQEYITKSLRLDPTDISLKKMAYGYFLKNEYELGGYLKIKSELETISPSYVSAMSGFIAAKTKEKCNQHVKNEYCENPLFYFRHQSLPNDNHFNEEILQNVRELFEANTFDLKDQKLLHNGVQTAGNLLSYEHSDISKLRELILRKLEEYKSEFESAADGVIKYWPQQYMIHAWLVSISSGGKLDPHIHENSWISGSIYISVPELEGDEGAIVVSESDEDSSYIRRITTLKSYDMCIFPASLCHHTLPFSSDEPRITLAFDVIPI